MEYKKIEVGSSNIHLIKTDKFRTIYTLVTLSEELTKENITKRDLLSGLLSYSTLKYPTRRDLMIAREDLYSACILSNTKRCGKYAELNFTLTVLEDKYTEDGNLEKCFELLKEMIFNPNIKNGKFDDDTFNILKEIKINNINGVEESKASLSMIRMLEEMAPSCPISVRSNGYLEDLNNITPSKLVEYYNYVINHDLVDIYVVGNIDFDKTVSALKKCLPFKSFIKNKYDAFASLTTKTKKVQVIKEKREMKQSKLSIGCIVDELNDFDLNYSLTLYNLILGGTADSKFFKNIREKHSVAYYVNSSTQKLDHILTIKSGIDIKNYDETVRLIKHEMKDMELGNFEESDIDNAKQSYITMIKSITDNQNAIAYSYAVMRCLHLGDLDERIAKINLVTKEDIIRVAKHIHINTIFLLEESETNEEA